MREIPGNKLKPIAAKLRADKQFRHMLQQRLVLVDGGVAVHAQPPKQHPVNRSAVMMFSGRSPSPCMLTRQ